MLADNNAGTFFAALGDAMVTGPTRTNINDLRILAYMPES
jgi:hydroxypyruvate reductase